MLTTNHFWTQWGIIRSLIIYYGQPWRYWRMIRFYRQFIQPGDLCFDVGSHVGNRLWIWSRLQARIIAIEPQSELMSLLRWLYGHSPTISLVEKAVGTQAGLATMHISQRNPTVNTLSTRWLMAVQRDPSFAHTRWNRTQTVTVTTLDALITEYGLPAFCKIDIEGHEQEALHGLSQPIQALSFEFIPVTISMAIDCLYRLNQLGVYEYNYSLAESHRLVLSHWVSSTKIETILRGMPASAKSGDVYARLLSPIRSYP